MRVIAGKKKGRVLNAPVPVTVRPTSDKAREALFMLLTQGAWQCGWRDGIGFVDLCAGVGTVGIEAWSRGARVVFVERDVAVIESLKINVARMEDEEKLTIIKGDAFAMPYRNGAFEVMFVDPPYGKSQDYSKAIQHWQERGWIQKSSRLILQLDKGTANDVLKDLMQSEAMQALEKRTYGRNVLLSGVLL